MPSFTIGFAFLAATAAAFAHGTGGVVRDPPVRLPDVTVVAESLKSFPFFSKTELKEAEFSPESAPLDAQYPGQAFYEGVSAGTATVGVMLDRQGHPTDFLVIRYTQPYFGDALMRAAQQQVFVPRRVRGLAVPGPFNFTYEFRPPSKVVEMSSFDAVTQRDEQVGGGTKFVFAPHVEREIDGGQLEATRVKVPVIPPGYASRNGKAPRVLLTFYVDELGHVRLPSVESAPSPALIADAIEAVQHWEFKPPKLKGQGVLVYAVRVLTFRAGR